MSTKLKSFFVLLVAAIIMVSSCSVMSQDTGSEEAKVSSRSVTPPQWTVNVTYSAGDLVSYNGSIYECRQPHTSYAPGWTPINAPALWLFKEKVGQELKVWEANLPLAAGEEVLYEADQIVYTSLLTHTAQATWLPPSTPSVYAPPAAEDTVLGNLVFNTQRKEDVKELYEEWKDKYIFYVQDWVVTGQSGGIGPGPNGTPSMVQIFDGAYVYFNGPSSWNDSEATENTVFTGSDPNGSLYGSHSDAPNRVTVSEAQAYGMLAAAQMDDAKTFEQLFNFYMMWVDAKGLMNWAINLKDDYYRKPNSERSNPTSYYPSYDTSSKRPSKSYLSRSMFVKDAAGGLGAATDGDLDIAYALILADKNGWGGGKYAIQAHKVLKAIREDVVHSEYSYLKISDQGTEGVAWEGNNWEKFPYSKVTRTSDFQLVNILTFKQFDSANASVWQSVYDATVKAVADVTSDKGLFPDFAYYDEATSTYKPIPSIEDAITLGFTDNATKVVDGETKPNVFLESIHDGENYFNACRTPWRLAAPLMGGVESTELENAITKWLDFAETAANTVDGSMAAGYSLDGTKINTYGSMLFDCPKMPVANALNDSDFDNYWSTYVTDVYTEGEENWNQIGSINSQQGFYNYFDDTVRLLAAISASYENN